MTVTLKIGQLACYIKRLKRCTGNFVLIQLYSRDFLAQLADYLLDEALTDGKGFARVVPRQPVCHLLSHLLCWPFDAWLLRTSVIARNSWRLISFLHFSYENLNFVSLTY